MDALDELYAAADPSGLARAMAAADADPDFNAARRAWLFDVVADHERSTKLKPAAE